MIPAVVDSTRSRKSRELSPSGAICTPSLAPVLRPRKLTDFSITRILGLENDETHKETICSGKWNFENLGVTYKINLI